MWEFINSPLLFANAKNNAPKPVIMYNHGEIVRFNISGLPSKWIEELFIAIEPATALSINPVEIAATSIITKFLRDKL